MKLVFSSHAEVCHIFASNTQASGRAGSVFFDDGVLYSYGRHFPMARFISDDVLLFTTQSYSKSTAKHLHLARNALRHKRLVMCDDPIKSIRWNISHERDMRDFLLSSFAAELERPRKRPAVRSRIVSDINACIGRASALRSVAIELGEELPEDTSWIDAGVPKDIEQEALRLLEEKRVRVAELERKRKIENRAALRDELDKLRHWRNGDPLRLSHHAQSLPIVLRINGDIIETSHGARVPVSDAIAEGGIWAQANDARKEGKERAVDFNIGAYSATLIEADGTIRVGCHRIRFTELARIAKQLGV